MPYCIKCGSPLKENDKFCAVCGVAAPKFTREEYSVSGICDKPLKQWESVH